MVKFSLSDQYLCYYNSLTILDIPSFLQKKANTKKIAFKLTKHLNSLNTISFFYIPENLDL